MKLTAFLLLAVLCHFCSVEVSACSAYKITSQRITMVGSNYDSWYPDPVIWFETEGYGAAFSGSRRVNRNTISPQSGLNVHGLSYVTLSAPRMTGNSPIGKKQITNRESYLKDILHSCKNVDEVREYIEQYDHSVLFNEVFLYTDSSGKFLIVEPFVITQGVDSNYVLANFYPSTILDFSSIAQQRYINGVAFLKNGSDPSLTFCSALSDTMHVCRKKVGDGTMLTSIFDLSNRIVNLYFYHNYNEHKSFDLIQELAKGDHAYHVESLFSPNEEYSAFLSFQTPVTSSTVQSILAGGAGFYSLSAIIFFFLLFRRSMQYRWLAFMMFALNSLMTFYLLILLRNEAIFYFPAPYKDYQFSILDIAAYFPFVVVLLLPVLFWLNWKLLVHKSWNRFETLTLSTTTTSMVLIVGLFFYWGLLGF